MKNDVSEGEENDDESGIETNRVKDEKSFAFFLSLCGKKK